MLSTFEYLKNKIARQDRTHTKKRKNEKKKSNEKKCILKKPT